MSAFVISVHIPKTAGTTVAYILDRCVDRRIIYDYDGYKSPAAPNRLIKQNRKFVSEYFRVLHGHFYVEKYLNIFPDARIIAAIRHPVDRIISQYNHEMNDDLDGSFFHDDITSGKMDVVDFAKQPGVGDAMSRHLGRHPLQEYACLIISEDVKNSLALLAHTFPAFQINRHFGVPLQVPNLNSARTRARRKDVASSIKKEIFRFTAQDNDLYARAMEIHRRRMKELS